LTLAAAAAVQAASPAAPAAAVGHLSQQHLQLLLLLLLLLLPLSAALLVVPAWPLLPAVHRSGAAGARRHPSGWHHPTGSRAAAAGHSSISTTITGHARQHLASRRADEGFTARHLHLLLLTMHSQHPN
jgi:hypothetical protein